MYEWPNDLDINSVFQGRELETITFAQYSMYLHFENKISLSIFSDCFYSGPKVTEEMIFPIRHTNIVSSIGSKVVNVELIDNKNICLWFADGAKFMVNGSTSEYECYSIKFENREFYV